MKELWVIIPMVVMVVGFIIVGIEIFSHINKDIKNIKAQKSL